jgi:hypothetical protein
MSHIRHENNDGNKLGSNNIIWQPMESYINRETILMVGVARVGPLAMSIRWWFVN